MTRRIPTLESERLLIRELVPEDLEPLHQILNEAFDGNMPLAERARWLQWTVLGYEMFALLGQPHYGERGMALKETGELIGAVGIVPYLEQFGHVAAFNSDPEAPATAEVGLYWAVDPAFQGRGYATEAARAVVDYLFGELKLGRVIATTGRDNLASQAVMRKLGMAVEQVENPPPPGIAVVGVLANRGR